MSPDLLDELQARYETSWQPGYAHFPRVLLDWNLKTGVELGVAFGGHSEAILRTGVSKLYGVDSYRHRSNYDDPMNLSQPDFDRLYDRTCRRLSYYGDRFIPIRRDSDKAVSDVPGLVDFVYIDADHSYEGVFSDLCRWITKVRIGGIIGGHDYGHKDFPGVRQAIDEFFRRFGWQVHVEGDGVWWVHTKSLNISYFIPAYNREDTITAAIESIVMGNLEPGDEVVIVDDGSSDNTARLINELASRWPAITVITHSRNKGGAAARNTAVEQAKQPIVFCLDSDNILAPRSVGPLLEFLVCSGADVAAFSEIRYFSGPAADITHSWFLKSGRFGLREYLGGIRVPGASGNYLFTKESWLRAGGYPEFAGALDTWGFGLRQVATGSKMMVKQHSHYLHRCGADSYWVRQTRQGNVDLLALQVLLPFLHLIDHRDADYVMSRKGRNSWLLNLDRRPLRLRAAATSRVPRYSSRFPTNIRSLLRQFVWHPFLNVTRPVRDAIGLRKRRFGVS